jgi:hypothetical protein
MKDGVDVKSLPVTIPEDPTVIAPKP